MLIILSPSKTINFKTPAPVKNQTAPLFSFQANYLTEKLRHFPIEEIAQQEHVSLKIATATREYAYAFSSLSQSEKAALFAYTGNVYDKLQPSDFTPDDLTFTQQHVRIFSALYGVLRPLDAIRPYRLDMNSKLIPGLYNYWQRLVTKEIKSTLRTLDNTLINLASAEYFKMLDTELLPAKCRIITPVFKQESNGRHTVKSLYAKQARGLMTRFIIQNKINDPEYLQGFSEDGYYFRPELSDQSTWVFTR